MNKTHYETLGVKKTSSGDEIRSAYRKLVMMHHPDRSTDPKSPQIFIAITEAYDVLGDPDRRQRYDERIELESKRKGKAPGKTQTQTQVKPPTETRTQRETREKTAPPNARKTMSISTEVSRLSVLFSRGQLAQAESLAKDILRMDPRQPVPYAILGDVLRGRGSLDEAQKMYAYAVQFAPGNQLYQRRYEELVSRTQMSDAHSMHLVMADKSLVALGVGGVVVLLAGVYVALSQEAPVMPRLTLMSSWTLGLFVMVGICGIAIGASMAIGNMLDRFSSVAVSSVGRVGPAIALGTIAIINFWVAAALYLILGTLQHGFNYTTTRLVTAVAGSTVLLSIAAALSPTIHPLHVLLWGGNLMYAGAICGWMVADSFRG